MLYFECPSPRGLVLVSESVRSRRWARASSRPFTDGRDERSSDIYRWRRMTSVPWRTSMLPIRSSRARGVRPRSPSAAGPSSSARDDTEVCPRRGVCSSRPVVRVRDRSRKDSGCWNAAESRVPPGFFQPNDLGTNGTFSRSAGVSGVAFGALRVSRRSRRVRPPRGDPLSGGSRSGSPKWSNSGARDAL